MAEFERARQETGLTMAEFERAWQDKSGSPSMVLKVTDHKSVKLAKVVVSGKALAHLRMCGSTTFGCCITESSCQLVFTSPTSNKVTTSQEACQSLWKRLNEQYQHQLLSANTKNVQFFLTTSVVFS